MTAPVSRRCFWLISSLSLSLLIPISAVAQQDDVPKNISTTSSRARVSSRECARLRSR